MISCQYNEEMDEFTLQFDAEGVLLLKTAVEHGDVIPSIECRHSIRDVRKRW